jgi:hypothetical protein
MTHSTAPPKSWSSINPPLASASQHTPPRHASVCSREGRGMTRWRGPFWFPRGTFTSAGRMSDAEDSGSEEQQEQEQTVFESADAGASHTFPMTASAVRKGGHMVIKGRPCKVRRAAGPRRVLHSRRVWEAAPCEAPRGPGDPRGRAPQAPAGEGPSGRAPDRASPVPLRRWLTSPRPRRASTATPSATSWRWTSSRRRRWRSSCRLPTTWMCAPDQRSQAAWVRLGRQKVAPAAAGKAGHGAQQEVVARSRT